MAATTYHVSGKFRNAPGASIQFAPVLPSGAPALGATDAQGERVAGAVTAVADDEGAWSANLPSDAGQDWRWRLAVRLPGSSRDLFRSQLAPLPARDGVTIDDLLPPSPYRESARGARWTDLLDTEASLAGRLGEFVRVGPDATLQLSTATPGQGIAGVRIERDGAAHGTAQVIDFAGDGVASAAAVAGRARVVIPRPANIDRGDLAAGLLERIEDAVRYDGVTALGPRSFDVAAVSGHNSVVELPVITAADIADGAVTLRKLAADAARSAQADLAEADTHSPHYVRGQAAFLARVAGGGGAAPRAAGPGLDLAGNALQVDPGVGLEIQGDRVAVKLDGASLGATAAGLRVLAVAWADLTGVPDLSRATAFTAALEARLRGIAAGAQRNPTTEETQDLVGSMADRGTGTDGALTYDDGAGALDLAVLPFAGAVWTLARQEVHAAGAQFSPAGDPDLPRGLSRAAEFRLTGGANADSTVITWGRIADLTPPPDADAPLTAANAVAWRGDAGETIYVSRRGGKWLVSSDTLGPLSARLERWGSALERFARRDSDEAVPPEKMGPGVAAAARDAAAAALEAGDDSAAADVAATKSGAGAAAAISLSLKPDAVDPAALRFAAGSRVAGRLVALSADLTGFEGVPPPAGPGGGLDRAGVDARIDALVPPASRLPAPAAGDAGEWVRNSGAGYSSAPLPGPTEQQVYALARAILQAGGGVGIEAQDAARRLVISALGVASGDELPPKPWHVGQRFLLLEPDTVEQDRRAQYLEAESTPTEAVWQLPGLPLQIRAYADSHDQAVLRDRAYLLRTGDYTFPAAGDLQLIWYEAGQASAAYAVSRAAAGALAHWHLINGTDFSDFDREDHAWYCNFISGSPAARSYPSATVQPGDLAFNGGAVSAGWIPVPGEAAPWARQGQPRPGSNLAVARLLDGPATGLTAVSGGPQDVAGAWMTLADPATGEPFDLAGQSGSVQVDIPMILSGLSRQDIGWGPGGVAKARTFRGFVFAADVLAAGAGTVEIDSADVYQGAATKDATIRLQVGTAVSGAERRLRARFYRGGDRTDAGYSVGPNGAGRIEFWHQGPTTVVDQAAILDAIQPLRTAADVGKKIVVGPTHDQLRLEA